MQCIFCKIESVNSKSVEHIIPESLGNKDNVLPRGTVCDSCNQYFARKIEKPVLESGMFRILRADRKIPSKRGRIPSFQSVEKENLPDFRIMTRFIGKIALEALAQRTLNVEDSNSEIVNQPELDLLREYVRFNNGELWPMNYRTLYPVNAIFEENNEYYDILHEYDLLYTEGKEMYIVVVLLGVEFVLNMGGRLLDGWHHWLTKNEYSSPLYFGENA